MCVWVYAGVCRWGPTSTDSRAEREEEQQSDEGEEWLIRKRGKVHHQQENSQTVDYSVAAVYVCVCVRVCVGVSV